ncbi:hypothetical protein HZA97_06780 [Candidatus Woesearchaeota archaeon]|nr:hypothetical protein [Candidatus Woesearchaeota archaeon]
MVELKLMGNERTELYDLLDEEISEGTDYQSLEGIQTKLQSKSMFPPDLTAEEASELTDLLGDKLQDLVDDEETATLFNGIYKQLVGRDHGKYESVYGSDE